MSENNNQKTLTINIKQRKKQEVRRYKMGELSALLLERIPGVGNEYFPIHTGDIVDKKDEVIRILSENIDVKIVGND